VSRPAPRMPIRIQRPIPRHSRTVEEPSHNVGTGNGRSPANPSLSPIHRYDEFNRIVDRRARWQHDAAGLQVAPMQGATDAVEDEHHPPLGSFHTHFHEALEEGRAVEIEDPGQGLHIEWPGFEPLNPVPERLLPHWRLGVHLDAKMVCLWIEARTADGGLLGEIERSAYTEIGPTAAINEVVHHARATVT